MIQVPPFGRPRSPQSPGFVMSCATGVCDLRPAPARSVGALSFSASDRLHDRPVCNNRWPTCTHHGDWATKDVFFANSIAQALRSAGRTLGLPPAVRCGRCASRQGPMRHRPPSTHGEPASRRRPATSPPRSSPGRAPPQDAPDRCITPRAPPAVNSPAYRPGASPVPGGSAGFDSVGPGTGNGNLPVRPEVGPESAAGRARPAEPARISAAWRRLWRSGTPARSRPQTRRQERQGTPPPSQAARRQSASGGCRRPRARRDGGAIAGRGEMRRMCPRAPLSAISRGASYLITIAVSGRG